MELTDYIRFKTTIKGPQALTISFKLSPTVSLFLAADLYFPLILHVEFDRERDVLVGDMDGERSKSGERKREERRRGEERKRERSVCVCVCAIDLKEERDRS
eukprot:1315723-Amorphochlora_amoeboformis.AAC.1